MAITKFKETRRSKEQSLTTNVKKCSREYRLWYAADANEAETYILANVPTSFTTNGDIVYLTSLTVTPDEKDHRVFTAALEFSTSPEPDRNDTGTETVSFDLSSQTVKTIQSPQTVNKYAVSGSTAPDFKGGIGWNGDKFEGADRFVEVFSFTVTKILDNASISNGYIQALRDTAFRYNTTLFRGQSPGECLFVGAAGSPRDSKTYSVAYKFLSSKNASGLTFGDISGVTKQGWDYLWTLFADAEDTTAKFITPRPNAVYIERLYTQANFVTNLGLSAG
jgi:hypothetical protein